VLTHFFAATLPGYSGWRWAVTLARASRSRTVTVDEVVLLPGDDALLAPDVGAVVAAAAAGDLGVGDLLPPRPTTSDSSRPTCSPTTRRSSRSRSSSVSAGAGDVAARPRRRHRAVVRRRRRAGHRDGGARARPVRDVRVLPADRGSLRAIFGVCGNAYSPRDGGVVSADAGCGAHSEAAVEPAAAPPPPPTYDDGVDIERA
jgi:hypothetical protein